MMENGTYHIKILLGLVIWLGCAAYAAHIKVDRTPSKLAAFQDVYLGTNETAVTNASTETQDIYQERRSGSQTSWNAQNLNSKYDYLA
jgi:hypothetical protein